MPTIKPRNQFKALTVALTALCTLAQPPCGAAGPADDPGCRTCLQSASGLFARGDNQGAAKILTEWQARCPNNLQLFLMLNTVLMRMPDGKKRALDAAEQACAIAPTSMLAHFQKAMTLMTLQQGSAAAREFQRVVELDPTSYEAWLALSELLGAEGKSQAAKVAEEHAAQLSPSARRSTLSSLASKDRAGNIQAFKQEVAKILDDPSTAPETLLIVGEEVFKLGYFEQSAQALGQAKSKYPDAPQIKSLLPYALFEAGKFSQSAQLIATDKSTAGGATQLAISGMDALASGDIDAAQKQIEKATAAGENQGIIYLAQGYLAMQSGRYKEAIEKLSDALAKNAALTVAKIYIAQANLDLGDLKEAIAQAKESQQKASGLKVRAEAIELIARVRDFEDSGTNIAALKSELAAFAPSLSVKDQALASVALGELALKNKDPGRAKDFFNSALGHMAGLVAARVGLARAALLEGDDKAALVELDQALALAPGNIDGLSIKALAQVESGDLAGAEGLLARATGEGELPTATCLALGKAYQKAGQNKEAVKYLKLAMQAGVSGSALEQAQEALTSLGEKAKSK
jgi:tetratricopeptide (TPR) repeat protein